MSLTKLLQTVILLKNIVVLELFQWWLNFLLFNLFSVKLLWPEMSNTIFNLSQRCDIFQSKSIYSQNLRFQQILVPIVDRQLNFSIFRVNPNHPLGWLMFLHRWPHPLWFLYVFFNIDAIFQHSLFLAISIGLLSYNQQLRAMMRFLPYDLNALLAQSWPETI